MSLFEAVSQTLDFALMSSQHFVEATQITLDCNQSLLKRIEPTAIEDGCENNRESWDADAKKQL